MIARLCNDDSSDGRETGGDDGASLGGSTTSPRWVPSASCGAPCLVAGGGGRGNRSGACAPGIGGGSGGGGRRDDWGVYTPVRRGASPLSRDGTPDSRRKDSEPGWWASGSVDRADRGAGNGGHTWPFTPSARVSGGRRGGGGGAGAGGSGPNTPSLISAAGGGRGRGNGSRRPWVPFVAARGGRCGRRRSSGGGGPFTAPWGTPGVTAGGAAGGGGRLGGGAGGCGSPT